MALVAQPPPQQQHSQGDPGGPQSAVVMVRCWKNVLRRGAEKHTLPRQRAAVANAGGERPATTSGCKSQQPVRGEGPWHQHSASPSARFLSPKKARMLRANLAQRAKQLQLLLLLFLLLLIRLLALFLRRGLVLLFLTGLLVILVGLLLVSHENLLKI